MYDLSPLRINGHYLYQYPAYDIDNYNILSPNGSGADPVYYHYYLNVCDNVIKAPDLCKESAPILRVRAQLSEDRPPYSATNRPQQGTRLNQPLSASRAELTAHRKVSYAANTLGMHMGFTGVNEEGRSINPDTTCTALGSLNAAIFDANPGADGVYLSYYHGDPSRGSRVYHHQSSIFFVCDNSQEGTVPTFEHQSNCFHSHFRVRTKHACKK
ncbi:Hypp7317 [Branchiostoma lanceolatum]|uniref:Hypp7317 protein n=1 Tax=Branchiostoma lanceolatum TaxID=7740 RepID=A0A8J9YZF0_BRALA|nr:Hypp7317 [Branchiostoma lanceolatum]